MKLAIWGEGGRDNCPFTPKQMMMYRWVVPSETSTYICVDVFFKKLN